MQQKFPIIRMHEIPPLLREISDPPLHLNMQGMFPDPSQHTFLAVVGSRKFTSYGKQACEKIISGLHEYPIIIVSGLALGMDAIAHRAALSAGLTTVAVPGSGLDQNVLYPTVNRGLAQEILAHGGALVSEFENSFRATPFSFPQRNRIMAGLSQAVLVVEAEERSGTLITSRLATEYNRDVFTIPGSIFSSTSKGPHMLLRLGATPITSSNDLLAALGFSPVAEKTPAHTDSPQEQLLLDLLNIPKTRDELIQELSWPAKEVSTILTVLELKGRIVLQGGKIRIS